LSWMQHTIMSMRCKTLANAFAKAFVIELLSSNGSSFSIFQQSKQTTLYCSTS
jgi:hypothetical protein